MRVGNNPLRDAPADALKPIVFCVVTHLPDFEGYHKDRLEVVQMCLTSMTQNADMDFSLAVWDNGSHPKVRKWIKDKLKPEVFVESINIGKTAARTALIRTLPPKKIACYSDDDIYYYPGWLSPQVELLRSFPNVACVTGYPVRTSFRWGNDNTREWARRMAKLEMGRFLPDEWETDFAVSIGRDPQWHREYTANDKDYRITWQGRQAYATSHHCQFIGWSEVVGRVVSWDDQAMGDERPFDVTLDTLGLRLATTQRYTRHIGNVLHEELKGEIELMPRA